MIILFFTNSLISQNLIGAWERIQKNESGIKEKQIVIFSSNGYILTNQHVIGDAASNITIELLGGSKTQAKVVGIDRETDLAVLKIEAENLDLPAIEIGNSDSLLPYVDA